MNQQYRVSHLVRDMGWAALIGFCLLHRCPNSGYLANWLGSEATWWNMEIKPNQVTDRWDTLHKPNDLFVGDGLDWMVVWITAASCIPVGG